MGNVDKPVLLLQVVYFPITRTGDPEAERAGDPERASAARLAVDLYELLCRPVADPLQARPGVQVRGPTRFDHVDTQEAEHVIIIPVLSEKSHRRAGVNGRVLDALTTWQADVGDDHVLPVLNSGSWRASESRMAVKPLLTQLYRPRSRHPTTLDEIMLGVSRALGKGKALALQLFISHAKADLKTTGNAAEKIRAHVSANTTGRAFFDKVSLLAGRNLGDQLDHATSLGVFLAIRGDAYSSRTWCQRELLSAKRNRIPTLTVEVLHEGEGRSAAYGGNGPTVVWDTKDKHAAARTVTRAMVEGLRAAVFRLEAERVIGLAGLPRDAIEVFVRPPELLDAPQLREEHPQTAVVLHPDPELSVHERNLLQQASSRLRMITPTTAFRGVLGGTVTAPLAGWQVAMSLSDTPDVDAATGLTREHANDATVFMARTLIGAGASIAYGGDFREKGFTPLLAQTIEAFNQTADLPADFLHAYLGLPEQPKDVENFVYTEHYLGPGGELEEEALLAPPTNRRALPPARRALYYSDMRRVMEECVNARILMGGAAEPKDPDAGRSGYSGRYPGVVEEAWRALDKGHPLYVAGGFGGAAALVVGLLQDEPDPPRLQEATWSGESWYQELTTALDADPDVAKLGLPPTMAALCDAIRAKSRDYLATNDTARAWNGLSRCENRLLFDARDPTLIASLILRGLLAVAASRSTNTLNVELVSGNLRHAVALELLAVPTFSDIPLRGAGAVIDEFTGGAATRANDAGGGPVELASDVIDAQWLFAASLGPVADALQNLPEMVQRAAARTSDLAQLHGFQRVGLVTFGGNTAEQLEQVIQPMVEGLQTLPATTQVFWFESDRERFDKLRAVLQGIEDVTLSTHVAPAEPVTATTETSQEETIVDVRFGDQALDVSVLVPRGNGVVPWHHVPFGPDLQAELVGPRNAGTPDAEALADHGRTLAEMLFGSSAAEVLGELSGSRFLVVHDVKASGIPYEALAAPDQQGNVITPALRGGMARQLRIPGNAQSGFLRPPRSGKLSVLLVINPREDLPHAEAEGQAVREQLQGTSFDLIELPHGKATVDAVCAAMEQENVDVLHYCGHAFFDGPGEHESGLKLSDGKLTLAHLRRLERLPRVAFVNACESGRVRSSTDRTHDPLAFAEYFIRAGVDAYLGTFWEVTDVGAAAFASTVYERLTVGKTLADAVVEGRRQLKQDHNNDWANYILYGDGDFRLVRV